MNENTIPRPEYPRPQLDRGADSWLNLNGKWEFYIDHGNSGVSRKMYAEDAEFDREIIVPFCPESRLSGIGNTDFMRCVWYRRTCRVPDAWDTGKGRVLLHFGAVDYFAEVWIDGERAGGHKGGYASFQLDITDRIRNGGQFTLTVRAEDNVHAPEQPSGKQSYDYYSAGCHYTRTTGIWQTVWLEYVPRHYVRHLFLTADVKN